MAKRGKAGAGKGARSKKGESTRKKFQAPLNTKTGQAGDAALNGQAAAGPPVQKMTPGATLKSLLNTCRGLKQNMDQINGKLREEIGFAKDKKNLHTGMFGILRRFDKMEAENAHLAWHTLVHYMEASGVMKKIDSVGVLPGMDGQQPEGGEVDEEDAGDGEAAEAAGEGTKEPNHTPQDARVAEASAQANGGIAPADEGKVTRPQFGARRAPQSQSEKAAEVAAAAGKPH